jgi:CDP-diacylglycerol--glycerol-3-phosphate 3-phosphatidyltransferase
LLNLPNKVTLARIILIPVFIVLLLSNIPYGKWLAVAVFAIMAISDSLDGYLARIMNQETKAGKFLDPLADKLVISAALISLVELRQLPAWIVIVIISREFIVSGLRTLAIADGKDLPASRLGKYKTFTQIVAVVFWIIKVNAAPIINIIAWVTMILALILSVYSGFDYFINLKRRAI